MAIKPTDLLNQLPTVSELLDKPPVRAMVDRWNRSVVARNLRSFLDEMRSELRRRTADVPMPSVRELAERAARYIAARRHQSMGTAINATGQVWGSQWSGRPLADTALDRMYAVGRDFTIEQRRGETPERDLEDLLCRLTGAPSAAVVHSYTGALWLALSAIAADREVLVSRAEIDEVELADPLPKVAAAAAASLKEIGTTSRTEISDYESAISDRTAALLRLTPDTYRVVGATRSAEIEELVALARDRGLKSIAALGAASIVDLPAAIKLSQPSIHASVAAGVGLTIARGDGLIGGPPCGILVGNHDVLQRITMHAVFGAWKLDGLRRAALAATLECLEDEAVGPAPLPIWQMVDAPLENLRHRAERLAAQLSHAEGIALAEVIETRSQLFLSMSEEQLSCAVALAPANGDVRSLEHRLRHAVVPIVGRIDGDRVVLDLRTVLPRQDKLLVDQMLDGSMRSSDDNASAAGVIPSPRGDAEDEATSS